MPEQHPPIPPEGQEHAQPIQPVEIDPTSMPGAPGYVPPEVFRENLDRPKAVGLPGVQQGGGHETYPFLANARHLENVAVRFGSAVFTCLMCRGVLNYIGQQEPTRYGKVVELASNLSTVLYHTGAAVMTAAVVTATVYRLEAKKIEEQYREW